MTGAARARRGPGRPPAGSEDKRERILDEALRLFATHGYSGTALGDIAEAAEISKAGLLHHFRSKDALFAAVLERRDLATRREDLRPDAPTVAEFLDSWTRIPVANARHPEGIALHTMMTGTATDTGHPAHPWLSAHLRGAVGTIAAALEAGKERGEVRADAPSRDIARALVALSDGLQVQWLSERAGTGVDPPPADARPPGMPSPADASPPDAPASDARPPTAPEPGTPAEVDMEAVTRLVVEALAARWLLPAR